MELRTLAKDIFITPRYSKSSYAFWSRNFLLFRQSWLTNFFWLAVEPITYLFAIGWGIGRLVPFVNGQEYIHFFFPALLATSVMMISSYETTYGTFTRFHRDKVFSLAILSPLRASDIFVAEIFWATAKATLSAFIIMSVSVPLKLVSLGQFPALLFTCWLMSWFFASLGLLVMSFTRDSDSFIIYHAGFLVPMALLCGTYFPLSVYPIGVQTAFSVIPLVPGLELLRSFLEGHFALNFLAPSLYFILLGWILSNYAIARSSRLLEQR